jgi:hypothetical protein
VLSRFYTRECKANKALEREEKSVKKAKAPSMKAKKRDVHMYVGM